MRKTVLFLGGLLFALLQFGYFVLLEWQLSSAWTTYAAVVGAWLAGSLAGLRLSAGRGAALQALNLPAYYGLWWVVRHFPFDQRLLPAYAVAVGLSGAYAGWFLRTNFGRTGDARAVLLHENNGFVAGLLASFCGFYLWGDLFLLAAPAASLMLLFGVQQVKS